MAVIIEGAYWTLTEETAKAMEKTGLIVKCDGRHERHGDLVEADKPVYHLSPKAPDWFGFSTIGGTIVEFENNIENHTRVKYGR